MEGWAVATILGVVAAGYLAQILFFVGMGWSGWRVFKRVRTLQAEVVRELRPVLDSVNEVSRNVSAISEVAALQVRQLQEALGSTAERIGDARREVGRSLRRPLRSVGAMSAALRGMRRAMRVYRQLGGLEAQKKGSTRRYREDEHLFI